MKYYYYCYYHIDENTINKLSWVKYKTRYLLFKGYRTSIMQHSVLPNSKLSQAIV